MEDDSHVYSEPQRGYLGSVISASAVQHGYIHYKLEKSEVRNSGYASWVAGSIVYTATNKQPLDTYGGGLLVVRLLLYFQCISKRPSMPESNPPPHNNNNRIVICC